MEYPIKEKWFGDKLVVAELEDFKILKFAPTGLLDKGSATAIKSKFIDLPTGIAISQLPT